jgi:SAM-dependent methyltransferase
VHRELLDLLACPACQLPNLDVASGNGRGDAEIHDGSLICDSCGATYPISGGIPRFVTPDDDYCENFGFQWQEWRTLQIDRLSGHHLSEERFLSDSRWAADWLKGKLILDAGCGAGRFTDIAAAHGARVIAVDISQAIDACHETTAIHDGRVHCIQASLFDLPLRPDIFDAVYCMGVIQHTPDPAGLMALLPRFLQPGGKISYNFYEEGIWRRLQIIKYALRLFTPHLSVNANLALSRFLVGLLYPLTRALAPIRKMRILNHLIPIAAVHDPQLTPDQQRAWTLLDTFDWYGARFEKRQHHQAAHAVLKAAGMENIRSESGLAWAEKPISETFYTNEL